MGRKTKEQIHTNMSHVKNSDTALENALCKELVRRGIKSFSRNVRTVIGKPDIAFPARKIAVFCDGDFWHGYDWENSQNQIKSNRAFWITKIEKNMARDAEVTAMLRANGWIVLRFWGHQIKKSLSECADTIEARLHEPPRQPYRTIDLCAGIGGIRKAFELTGRFQNIISAEIDKYACQTYEHLFGKNPYNDLTSEDFKMQLEGISYEILLAGFPCQTFSRVGLEEGFENEEKGQIFFHIADIISRTRPCAFFLENVGHLVTHDKGRTIKTILDTLVLDLNYHLNFPPPSSLSPPSPSKFPHKIPHFRNIFPPVDMYNNNSLGTSRFSKSQTSGNFPVTCCKKSGGVPQDTPLESL